MDIMPIEYIEDWQERLNRQDAFWAREVIDRPPACLRVPCSNPAYPAPLPRDGELKDRWLDTGYVVQKALHQVMNTLHLGDALPHAWPNLGPEVFSAFFGAELRYGESTAWSVPNLEDWGEAESIKFSRDNEYFRKLDEMTDALLDAGKNMFYTGMTDLHPGGDAIAAFRDPARLAVDMIDCPDRVEGLLGYVTDVFCEVYDYYAGRLQQAGQPISSWAGIVSTKRYYVPSNDFSCMISNEMFRRVFLPGIAEECAHLEASVYHLDGPNAVQHLDSLLELDDLDAIQWVPGAGHGPCGEWMDLYKKCQEAGKGLQIHLKAEELPLFMDELRPEGLWLSFPDVTDRDTAEALLRQLRRWT